MNYKIGISHIFFIHFLSLSPWYISFYVKYKGKMTINKRNNNRLVRTTCLLSHLLFQFLIIIHQKKRWRFLLFLSRFSYSTLLCLQMYAKYFISYFTLFFTSNISNIFKPVRRDNTQRIEYYYYIFFDASSSHLLSSHSIEEF